MTYSMLRPGRKFHYCWLAATWEKLFEQVRDKTVMCINVAALSDDIRNEVLLLEDSSKSRKYTLKLSSTLIFGLIKIYNRQYNILYNETIILSNKIITRRSNEKQKEKRPRRRPIRRIENEPEENEITIQPMTEREIITHSRRVTLIEEPVVYTLEKPWGESFPSINQSVMRDNPNPAILVASPEINNFVELQNGTTMIDELSELVPAISQCHLEVPNISVVSIQRAERTSPMPPIPLQLEPLNRELEPLEPLELERRIVRRRRRPVMDEFNSLRTAYMKNRMIPNISCNTAEEERTKLLRQIFVRTSRELFQPTNHSFTYPKTLFPHSKEIQNIIKKNFKVQPLPPVTINDVIRDEQRERAEGVSETLNISSHANITAAYNMDTMIPDANIEVQSIVLQSPLKRTINMDSVEIPIDKTIQFESTSIAHKDVAMELQPPNSIAEIPNNDLNAMNPAIDDREKITQYLNEEWDPEPLLMKIVIDQVKGTNITLNTLVENNPKTCNVPMRRIFSRAFYSLLRLKSGSYVDVEKFDDNSIKSIKIGSRVMESLKKEFE